MTERPMPDFTADEKTMLSSWLDFYRNTLLWKCQGLDDAQARTASVAPSPLTLLGLIQHLAEVERNWFRRVLAAETAPAIYHTGAPSTVGHDGGFDVADDGSLGDAIAIWQDEIAHARTNCASRELTDSCRFMDSDLSLRWIYVHMIGEYARHCGHADLIRERVDGVTGV
jgi:uncharacterized damage-inducible protein DinB